MQHATLTKQQQNSNIIALVNDYDKNDCTYQEPNLGFRVKDGYVDYSNDVFPRKLYRSELKFNMVHLRPRANLKINERKSIKNYSI